jgi:hypothetical protein
VERQGNNVANGDSTYRFRESKVLWKISSPCLICQNRLERVGQHAQRQILRIMPSDLDHRFRRVQIGAVANHGENVTVIDHDYGGRQAS